MISIAPHHDVVTSVAMMFAIDILFYEGTRGEGGRVNERVRER